MRKMNGAEEVNQRCDGGMIDEGGNWIYTLHTLFLRDLRQLLLDNLTWLKLARPHFVHVKLIFRHWTKGETVAIFQAKGVFLF